MYTYIKDKLSVIERMILRKNIQIHMIFFAEFTFSAKMRHVETRFFNMTYKEGRFYQKQSELGFGRCGSGRKRENRYPNWRYL